MGRFALALLAWHKHILLGVLLVPRYLGDSAASVIIDLPTVPQRVSGIAPVIHHGVVLPVEKRYRTLEENRDMFNSKAEMFAWVCLMPRI